MDLTGGRTYVGLGFGAIQAGLFLYEAHRSGNFGRLVVAEVLPDVVDALRRADGVYSLNIAHPDRIVAARVGPVEIDDPAVAAGRDHLVAALAGAHEIGTAIPSVTGYRSAGPGSLHRLLAAGLRRKAAAGGPPALLYAAENHNHAAEILEAAVLDEVPAAERPGVRARVQFLNTVIGKMSGLVTDPDTIEAHGLTTATPGGRRAFLVEAFNRILISPVQVRVVPDGPLFSRGITVLVEKPDLLPFEEAKLYGHNATHALAAYLGALGGVQRIADLRAVPGALDFLRAAFVKESGQALVRKHAGVDPLFTPAGYAGYADDLLARMTNPYLLDTVERVGRDPARKLGWNDRLVGTIRLALAQGMTPWRYALGAAAALVALEPAVRERPGLAPDLLVALWQGTAPGGGEVETVVHWIEAALQPLRAWCAAGCGDWTGLERRVPRG